MLYQIVLKLNLVLFNSLQQIRPWTSEIKLSSIDNLMPHQIVLKLNLVLFDTLEQIRPWTWEIRLSSNWEPHAISNSSQFELRLISKSWTNHAFNIKLLLNDFEALQVCFSFLSFLFSFFFFCKLSVYFYGQGWLAKYVLYKFKRGNFMTIK